MGWVAAAKWIAAAVVAKETIDAQKEAKKEAKKSREATRAARKEEADTQKAIKGEQARREKAMAINELLKEQSSLVANAAGLGGGGGLGASSFQGGSAELTSTFAGATGFNQAISKRQEIGVQRTQKFLDAAARAQSKASSASSRAQLGMSIFSIAGTAAIGTLNPSPGPAPSTAGTKIPMGMEGTDFNILGS